MTNDYANKIDYKCRYCLTSFDGSSERDYCERNHKSNLPINEYTKDMFSSAFDVVNNILNEENTTAWDDTLVSNNDCIILYQGKEVYRLPMSYYNYRSVRVHPSIDKSIEPIWINPDMGTIDITFLNRMLQNINENALEKRFKKV